MRLTPGFRKVTISSMNLEDCKPEGVSSTIRVLIVDDHPVVRLGMRTMLESEGDISVVAMAATGKEAINEAEVSQPDVVLIDLRMPEMSGVEAIRQLRRNHPDIRILVLTNYEEDEYIRRAFQAGAMGYLLKNTPQKEIVEAIHAVRQGKRYIPVHIAQRLLGTLGREELSERELEVLKLAAKGLSNKEIAQRLSISDKTARNHVAKCLAKLGADDRTEATMKAVMRGLINLT
jgi:DNA-binding NarL/FixJ family response regulator